jgi:lysozyme
MPSPVVIDLSHHQATVNFVQVATARRGVIHKATQGASYVDPRFRPREALARSVSLLWGSYHFGDGSSVAAQVKNYLNAVAPGTLLVLDVEENSAGSTMTQAQAEEFVQRVQGALGVYPVVYGGAGYLGAFRLKPVGTSVLEQCPVWWAQYTTTAIPSRLPSAWPTWSLWQYTDRGACPGVQGGCDNNAFNGDNAALELFWHKHSRPQ